jgi:hypothetical protein
VVLSYLNGSFSQVTRAEGKRRALDALRAYWQPYAVRAKNFTEAQQRETARTAITALQWQIQSICSDFGLETATTAVVGSVVPPTSPALNPISPGIPAKSAAIFQQAPITTNAGFQPVSVTDDDLLGDLV